LHAFVNLQEGVVNICLRLFETFPLARAEALGNHFGAQFVGNAAGKHGKTIIFYVGAEVRIIFDFVAFAFVDLPENPAEACHLLLCK
jgi:hypothetical protein